MKPSLWRISSSLREIGVMKALGAGRARLAGDMAAQAGWTVGLALMAAVPSAIVLGWMVEAATGNVAIAVETPAVVRAAGAAALVGGLGAVATASGQAAEFLTFACLAGAGATTGRRALATSM